ncbi:serine protease [Longimicrobium sp.]|uniref:trypsin-like serine peptidase n=1 Tax=Longimicrobium sp. TaxID=2029185 RepID=UPI002C17AB51|nr:serine protease [Longimicrobium sp.]HSU13799.1 serine protease [Longimicrobium sp.]
MESIHVRIRSALDRIARTDPRLSAELAEFRARNVTRMAAANFAADLGMRDMETALALDAVTLPLVRPVLPVIMGEAALHFLNVESERWRERLTKAHDNLMRAVRATGRIEAVGTDQAWLGTGFLIENDVVVTNQHIAHKFADREGEDFNFRVLAGTERMTASIDCLEEFGNDADESRTYRVVDILHLQIGEIPDVAFLQVVPNDTNALPDSLRLASAPAAAEDFVAAIGYPSRNDQFADQKFIEALFPDGFGKKCLAPGQITGAADGVLHHDCSTLSGNSGSPVVSLSSGEVVGLHFRGANVNKNHAVPAARVAEQLHLAGRSLRPGGGPARRNDAGVFAGGAAAPVRVNVPGTVRIPIQVTITLGEPQVATAGAGEGEERE